MNKTETIELIKSRRVKLLSIGDELKSEFFGLDNVIDRIINSVQTWYLLPEALVFPVIINLWGLTGVGKTDLVRKLVKKLTFQDRFVEIQMDGFSNGGYFQDSVCEILQTSSIDEGSPGIILLDEFQRFRTIEMNGKGECKELEVKRFQDVWMLLSDGKFASDYSLYTKIQRELLNDAYNDDRKKSEEDEEREVVYEKESERTKRRDNKTQNQTIHIKKFGMNPWQALDYKKLLKLKEPVSEIMTWDIQKINYLCQEALNKRISGEFDYSKCLIFICGNLDEAFKMASSALEDCDTDADIFHEQTKKLSVIDIKRALQERFRPEQIARMGNTHIIYPSLSRESYEKIVKTTSDRYSEKLLEKIGVPFTYDNSTYTEIYKNAVYPTQGTRPVFSSVHQILSSPMVDLSIWAIENNIPQLHITIDESQSVLTGTYGEFSKSIPVLLDIRAQRERNTEDFNTLVAVHEAGHSLVYAVLRGCAPKEIKINLVSFKGGFSTFDDQDVLDKKTVENIISEGLGGGVAEEIIFGKDYKTNGSVSDLTLATEMAAKYIKYWCFANNVAQIRCEGNTEWAPSNYKDYDYDIEELVKTQRNIAEKIIRDYIELFKIIVCKLLKNETITKKEFVEIAKPFIPNIKETIDEVSPPYSDIWDNFMLS